MKIALYLLLLPPITIPITSPSSSSSSYRHVPSSYSSIVWESRKDWFWPFDLGRSNHAHVFRGWLYLPFIFTRTSTH